MFSRNATPIETIVIFFYHASLSLTVSIFQFPTEMPPQCTNCWTKQQVESPPPQLVVAPPLPPPTPVDPINALFEMF